MMNATHSTFVFLPVDIFIKVTLYFFVAFFAVYGVVANGLILHFSRKHAIDIQRKPVCNRPFSRRAVTSMFVQSLAASDLLCSIISLPLAIATNFLPIIDTDLKCKAVRFCNIFFPVVTINNLFVIGIERYLAVFHPFRVPTLRRIKSLVVGAWVFGLTAVIPAVTYRLHRYQLDSTTFTTICSYDKTNQIYRIMFLSFNTFSYVVPAIILTATNMRILLYLNSRKRNVHSQLRLKSWRFYGTFAFVALIFAFIVPYLLFVVFSLLSTAINLPLSFQNQYILKRTGAIMAYSNTAVSPTVLLLSMKDLRTMLQKLLKRRRLTPNVVARKNRPANQNVYNVLKAAPQLQAGSLLELAIRFTVKEEKLS